MARGTQRLTRVLERQPGIDYSYAYFGKMYSTDFSNCDFIFIIVWPAESDVFLTEPCNLRSFFSSRFYVLYNFLCGLLKH